MKKQSKSKESSFNNFLKEFKDNIAEGAKSIGEKTHEWFEEAKDKADDLYEMGSEKYEQASTVVLNYTEKYKGEKEVKELSVKKTVQLTLLGDHIFHEFKKNNAISKRFLSTKKMNAVMHEIELIDKRILKIGKELDKL